ncbi:hypothetical protein BDY19DRAFT_907612 [Irpex rosettiformis]|uniref:Uncharacterized protein n=1 Tax=Irpex rosettiformis TaxID=378272 RepID=A0ACB8TZK5_9APHY|nr:hypothetical protein BDY19DRAFT_907612 [Irpex rosettiformis]
MPFERYLNSQPSHTEASSPDQHPAFDSSPKHDIHLDHSIFSANVQFQMPQLMLGPTLPPGGGAEVLPAGIVGNPSAVASTWLGPSFSRYPNDYWMLSPQEALPISHPIVLPPYQSPSTSSRPHVQQTAYDAASCSHVTLSPSCSTPVSAAYSLSSAFDQQPVLQVPASLRPPVPVTLPLAFPHAAGFPVYSTSGFDLLSILARVITRPNPKIMLGPVDMTCSFVVVDTRRYDSPVVYASPTFCKLTGYSENEVVGRNCRFLQSPDGIIQRGEHRRHTAQEAVAHMRKSLSGDKECQVSLINYRKDGSAFVNLVTVIPIRGGVHNLPDEADEVVYQIGFQVDLTEQPNAILQKLRDGSYMVNYSREPAVLPGSFKSDWQINASGPGVSKSLRALLNSPDFLKSIPFSLSTTTLSITPQEPRNRNDEYDGNKPLSLLLLESSPDFVLALSLKGAFLYVSPSVRRVLGYEAEDLIGKSVTDFCHEADKVPVVRELKESSATPSSNSSSSAQETSPPVPYSHYISSSAGPRIVDLLFRMRVKDESYVWLECRGRLYVEPGKGRKAIILSGRVRSMASLTWAPIARAGGLVHPKRLAVRKDGSTITYQEREQEFWALLSSGGSFLFAGTAVRDVLGWGAGEIIGRSLCDFICGRDSIQGRTMVEETLHRSFTDASMETRNVACRFKRKDGSRVPVEVIFFHPTIEDRPWLPDSSSNYERPLICQVKVSDGVTSTSIHAARLVHPESAKVFDELEVSCGSTWQYELQQLKFANQRLREEVEALEAHVQRESEARTQALHQTYRTR